MGLRAGPYQEAKRGHPLTSNPDMIQNRLLRGLQKVAKGMFGAGRVYIFSEMNSRAGYEELQCLGNCLDSKSKPGIYYIIKTPTFETACFYEAYPQDLSLQPLFQHPGYICGGLSRISILFLQCKL